MDWVEIHEMEGFRIIDLEGKITEAQKLSLAAAAALKPLSEPAWVMFVAGLNVGDSFKTVEHLSTTDVMTKRAEYIHQAVEEKHLKSLIALISAAALAHSLCE